MIIELSTVYALLLIVFACIGWIGFIVCAVVMYIIGHLGDDSPFGKEAQHD